MTHGSVEEINLMEENSLIFYLLKVYYYYFYFQVLTAFSFCVCGTIRYNSIKKRSQYNTHAH